MAFDRSTLTQMELQGAAVVTSMIKILLIDDHALFRSGLRMVLATGLENTEIQEVSSMEEAMQLLNEPPSILLLDIQLRGLNGLDGIALLKRKWPETPVVVLSSDDTEKAVSESIRRGAAGFVSKNDSADHILSFIQLVLRGGCNSDQPIDCTSEAEQSSKPLLTPRQLEVLDFLCQGLSNKAIGRRMDLSENTIRGHVQAILAALRVESRSQAVSSAHRRGLVH